MKSFIIVILLFVPFYLFTQNPVICDCIAPDTGQGTTNYPIPCLYSSETDVMEIIEGRYVGFRDRHCLDLPVN